MLCYFFSSFYHLFFVKNEKLSDFLLRLDYAGICFLICGSTYPLTYYGFYCDQTMMWTYLGINSTAAIIIFVISLMDFIHTPKYFTLKSIMYAALGLFSATPLFHLLFKEHFKLKFYSTFATLPYYIAMAITDYAGLLIYAKR